MNPICLIPVAVIGLPALWFVIDRNRQAQREISRQACFEFDLSLARSRYRERTGCDEGEAALVEHEFRRFFQLLAENPGRKLGLHNGAIDDYWHELICCTALYRDYCTQVAARFVHHDPQGGSGDGYAKTWWAYHDRFREAPPLSFWPTPAPGERRRARQNDDDDGWVFGDGCGGGSSCASDRGGGASGCCGDSGCGGGGMWRWRGLSLLA